MGADGGHSKTIKHIAGAWVKEQAVAVEDGKITSYITSYRVNLMLTFILDDKGENTNA